MPHVVIALLLVAQASTSAPLVRPRTIGDGVQCPACRIEHERVASFGDEGTVFVEVGTPLAKDSRGYIYAADYATLAQIYVLGRHGKPIRVIGRKGQGPGEFSSITAMAVGVGDTLY